MNSTLAVCLAFAAIGWPAALMLFLAWRDEHNPNGWCASIIGALDHGIFGGRP